MRSQLRRLRSLADRYRLDRRLPPVVADLIGTVARLRRDEAIASRLARLRPVLRSGNGNGREAAEVARLANRRIQTAGALDIPASELAHRNARTVVDVLEAGGCDPFLVAHSGDRLIFGVRLDDRSAALAALERGLGGTGWYLEWEYGRRTGLVPMASASLSRVTSRARTWRIFEARSFGAAVVGAEQAVELGFWHPGTSGQLELVGTRGQERFDEGSERTVEIVDSVEYPGRSAFPVGTGLERLSEPVDIVFTWVDGGEHAWQQQFRAAAHAAGRSFDETALDGARYEVRDELRYALRSVWAYCGWARNIYVVTAGQRPDWFVGDDRVRIVDHAELLPADALPTFNSHAIEASLHRIPGLAEHFIYFNDDMFVARPTRPETFFTSNGLARVFQGDARVAGVESDDTLGVDTAALRGRDLLRDRFGRVVEHKPLHSPYPLRRSVIEHAERDFPDAFARTVHSRFRSSSDVSVAASFGQHFGLAVGMGVLSDISTEYINVESGRLAWHLDRIRLGSDLDTFCINATNASTEGQGQEQRDGMIAEFFEAVLPVPSPWER